MNEDENPSAQTPEETHDHRPGEAGEELPPAPDGLEGETRTVAARSGSDTSFPERPIPADPVEASPEDQKAGHDEGRTPEPDMGPSS
ncbi:hypothetical protein ACFFMN_08695 [Planobispora siamensis]|nr:hypothetical protein [Planobispora siamensis]